MTKKILCGIIVLSLLPFLYGAFDDTKIGICTIQFYCPCGIVNAAGVFEFCDDGWGICFDGSGCVVASPPDCDAVCGGGSGGGGGSAGGGGADPCDPASPGWPTDCDPWQM